MFRRVLGAVIVIVAAGAAAYGASLAIAADPVPIDVARSQLTISVSKSGFFSAFADNHTVRAPIASGSLSTSPPLSVALTVRARDLEVLDPDLAADKRREVQTRMLGREVLDVDTFPEIAFRSTTVEPSGADRWKVEGELALHGQTRKVSFEAALARGAYRGSARIRQRDFGITPISIAGGTVKVKDELLVEFAIVARGS